MGRYRTVLEVKAPVKSVWELMVDPDRLTEWNAEFATVENITGHLDRVGTTFTQVRRVPGSRYVAIGRSPSLSRSV